MKTDIFWANYEEKVENYSDLHEKILFLSNAASRARRNLVWRGQKDSSWPLHSKLYRNFLSPKSEAITENEFAEAERKILTNLRRWGLHSQRNIGRLSVLSQLAMLQHFGAPTRLLDITFNALVGAFFATEEDKELEDRDARLFAIDISDRLINENKNLRCWEDSLDTPWSSSFIEKQFKETLLMNKEEADLRNDLFNSFPEFKNNWLREWSSHFYAWKPPALDARIAAQNGGFLFGGIVGATLREGYLDPSLNHHTGGFQLVDPTEKNKRISISETRTITSLAIQPKLFPNSSIRENSKNSVYCIRITASAKKGIRERLRQIFGYRHSTIYPDFPGFSQFNDID